MTGGIPVYVSAVTMFVRYLKIAIGWLAALAGLLAIGWTLTGLAMAAGGLGTAPRGQMVDVGGRSMRIVCEGTRAPGQPLVLFESGAYSGAADWGWVQPQVSAFARTCSYDRAGIGWSDPSPEPRSIAVINRDLAALLAAAGEAGPYVIVGHSMAGLLMRGFIIAQPEQVAGVVFVDAADPSFLSDPNILRWVQRYQRMARWGASASRFGLVKPLGPFFANGIGLPAGPALDEKRRLFGNATHLAGASAEINQIGEGVDALGAADVRLSQIPVSSITAGGPEDPRNRVTALSPSGRAIAIAEATHTSLLGPRHGTAIVTEVRRILDEVTGTEPAR
ncbi:MAG: alpha/beta hydrolase [Hyphomonadaceae bacterium]|nr:alpha/beta hydrolase [Hyphomonadaceae bacterium]